MKDNVKKWNPYRLFNAPDTVIEPLTVVNHQKNIRSKQWKARAQRASARIKKRRGILNGFEHPRIKPTNTKKKPKIRYVK